jgi:hypothetical protein
VLKRLRSDFTARISRLSFSGNPLAARRRIAAGWTERAPKRAPTQNFWMLKGEWKKSERTVRKKLKRNQGFQCDLLQVLK